MLSASAQAVVAICRVIVSLGLNTSTREVVAEWLPALGSTLQAMADGEECVGRRRAARAVPQEHVGATSARRAPTHQPLEEGSFWALLVSHQDWDDEFPLCLCAAAIAKDQQICSIFAIGQVQWKLDRGKGATL